MRTVSLNHLDILLHNNILTAVPDRENTMKMCCRLTMILLVLIACGSAEDHAMKEPLSAAETFTWTGQPLRFQPPPADWRRDRYNQGGLLGVDFIHSRSVGERIYLAEFTSVGRRSEREGHAQIYRLEDVMEETLFSTEGWPLPPDSFVVSDAVPDTIAGIPAYRLDFTLNTPERQLVGREYYLLHNNHLFEAAFLGLPENLPLFERVVATISFPPEETNP
jgi:hypothetical protein